MRSSSIERYVLNGCHGRSQNCIGHCYTWSDWLWDEYTVRQPARTCHLQAGCFFEREWRGSLFVSEKYGDLLLAMEMRSESLHQSQKRERKKGKNGKKKMKRRWWRKRKREEGGKMREKRRTKKMKKRRRSRRKRCKRRWWKKKVTLKWRKVTQRGGLPERMWDEG